MTFVSTKYHTLQQHLSFDMFAKCGLDFSTSDANGWMHRNTCDFTRLEVMAATSRLSILGIKDCPSQLEFLWRFMEFLFWKKTDASERQGLGVAKAPKNNDVAHTRWFFVDFTFIFGVDVDGTLTYFFWVSFKCIDFVICYYFAATPLPCTSSPKTSFAIGSPESIRFHKSALRQLSKTECVEANNK